MPRSVPKRVVTRSSKTAARGPATAPEVPSEAEKSPDSGPELDLNALIVEIDLEKLVLGLEVQDVTLDPSNARILLEPLRNGPEEPPTKDSDVPKVERRLATRLSNSEVGDHVQVSLPRAARTGLVNVSDTGVLIETNCQLFPGRTTDVFVRLRGERLALRATVVRSFLHSLTSEGLVYRSALHFERIIGLSEHVAR